MKTKNTEIVLGEIKVKALIFKSPFGKDHYYVCGRDDMDYLDFIRKYDIGSAQAKRATAVGMDNGDYPFFMCFVANCFDPPVAIVRQENEEEAIADFIDQCEWARVEPEDYGAAEEFEQAVEEGIVGIADGGNYYDAEQIQCVPIKLFRVEME
jgi:hypothetical protein